VNDWVGLSELAKKPKLYYNDTFLGRRI